MRAGGSSAGGAHLSAAGPGRPAARLTVLAGARHDVVEAADYYDEEVPGLGGEFVAEYARVLARVAAAPAEGSPVPGARPRRRMLFDRFPYAVVYRELAPGRVRVIAVAHHRRRPGYWARRDR